MTRSRLMPDYDKRLLAAYVTPVFVAAALSGFIVQGAFSVLVAMVVVAFLLWAALNRAHIGTDQ